MRIELTGLIAEGLVPCPRFPALSPLLVLPFASTPRFPAVQASRQGLHFTQPPAAPTLDTPFVSLSPSAESPEV